MPPATNTTPSPVAVESARDRHQVTDILAVFTLLVGLAAAPLGFIVAAHVVASVLGAVGLVVGLIAQMVSATRVQRMAIVTGLVGAFLGIALGIGHGGYIG
jgi:FtsH-binding integral membrane protein